MRPRWVSCASRTTRLAGTGFARTRALDLGVDLRERVFISRAVFDALRRRLGELLELARDARDDLR